MLKYEMVVEDIEKSIEDGTLKPYDRLPTVIELCEMYNVSRSTINQVMDELSDRGLVARRKGSGVYVKNVINDADTYWRTYNQIVNSNDDGTNEEGPKSTEVVEYTISRPDKQIAKLIGMDDKEFAYFVCRVHKSGQTPTSIEYIYLPVDVVPNFRFNDAEGSIEDFIEKTCGLKIESFHKTIRAVEPSAEERAHLRISYGVPLLELERVGFLSDGRPFGYIITRYPGFMFEYRTVYTR